MTTIRTDRRDDPFSNDHASHSTHHEQHLCVLRHPKVGTLKLGASDFDLWRAYQHSAQPQPHFKTVAGLYATYQREDAKLGKNIEIAFAELEGNQAIRKAMGIPQPGGPKPTGRSQ